MDFHFHRISAKEIKASLGEFNRAHKNSTQKLVARIKQIIRHPEFQISDFRNDIAILKLDNPIPFDLPHIRTACLPKSSESIHTDLPTKSMQNVLPSFSKVICNPWSPVYKMGEKIKILNLNHLGE